MAQTIGKVDKIQVVDVNQHNIDRYGFFCSKNKKDEGFQQKRKWLLDRFEDGLKIKLLQDEMGKDVGFIEYLPGEQVWKPIKASGYLAIHCIMVQKKAHREHGYGSVLIQACLQEARELGKSGVVVATSDGPWVAGKKLFAKNGFVLVDQLGRFELMANTFQKAVLPSFINWEKNLGGYQGLHLVYSHQCPWHAKSVRDLKSTAANAGVELFVTEIKNAKSAQQSPTGFGNFGLIYQGRLLEDHYLSSRRFMNILEKELQLATF